MTATRHPEPALAAWLADGPTAAPEGLRGAIKLEARAVRQRRQIVIRLDSRALRLVALAAALATLTVGALLVSGRIAMPPTRSPGPSSPPPSGAPSPRPTFGPPVVGFTLGRCHRFGETGPCTWAYTTVGIDEPGGLWDLDTDHVDGWGIGSLVFGTHHAYGLPGPSEPAEATVPPAARGIAFADVGGTRTHGAQPVPIGDAGAAQFLANLAGVDCFSVGPVERTTLDGRAAFAATVHSTGACGDSHLDVDAGGGSSIDFRHPSRVIVSDFGRLIVAVQIWATSDAGLAAWVPEAMRIVAGVRFHDGVI